MSASSKKKLRKELNAAALTEKQQKAQAEAKKLKVSTTIFVIVMVVVLIAALTVMAINAVRGSGIIEKNTVALTVGEHEINAVEMNYYFNDAVNNTYSEWGTSYGEYLTYYLAMMGLDVTKPLDEQTYYDGEGTWADYFKDMAVNQAKANYALYDAAIADGYTLNDTDKEVIENNLSGLQMYAMMNQVDLDTFVGLYYGAGAKEKSLRSYMEVVALANRYYTEHEESLSYDDTAIRAYEADKYNNFSSYSYNSYYLGASDFLPEGVTEPTAEQTATALAEAKAAAESLLTATNVIELDKAIAALDINAGASSAESNAYENTLYTNISSSVQEWISDPARQENDIAVLPYETVVAHDHDENVEHEHEYETQGYYVVMFGSATDNTQPMSNVRHLLVRFKTESDGSVTDENKAAAKAEAEGYLEQWKSGAATEDSFIELVKKHSADSSADQGGLFEDIHPDSAYVDNFLNWSIDASRKTGDTEVIETEYGYHVMYYVGQDEMTYRDFMITEAMTAADMDTWYEGILNVTVTEGDLSKLPTDIILDPNAE